MSKKSRKTPSAHRQVVSLISSQLPCGACMSCLKVAVEREADAVLNARPSEQARYDHLVSVAHAVARKYGVLETMECLTNLITKGFNVPSAESLVAALQIMGFKKLQEAA